MAKPRLRKARIPFLILTNAVFCTQILFFVHRVSNTAIFGMLSLPILSFFTLWLLIALYQNFTKNKIKRNQFNYMSALMLIFSTLTAALFYFAHTFIPYVNKLPVEIISPFFQGLIGLGSMIGGGITYAITHNKIITYVKKHGHRPPQSKFLAILTTISIILMAHACTTFFFKQPHEFHLNSPTLWITCSLITFCASIFIYLLTKKPYVRYIPDHNREHATDVSLSSTFYSEYFHTIPLSYDHPDSRNLSEHTPRYEIKKKNQDQHSTMSESLTQNFVQPVSRHDPKYWHDKGMKEGRVSEGSLETIREAHQQNSKKRY